MPCLSRIRPSTLGLLVEHIGGGLGEAEARHDVGHEAHALAVDLAAQLLAVGLVDQAEHGVGVGVVDELVRQEGVQQRLDRRVGRHRIEQVGALHAHHVLVGHVVARAQLDAAPRAAPRAGRRGSIVRHVPARALDAEHVGLVAEQVGHAQSSPRCCRRRAAPASDRRRAGAWCRRAAPDRARRPPRRSDRPQPWRRDRPSGFASSQP